MSQECRGGITHPLYNLNGEEEGEWFAMPEPDIANLGKAREQGICWYCGDFAEVILTSSTYLTGVAPPQQSGCQKSLAPEEVARRVSLRAQKQVRRLVNTNRFSRMWTLTQCPDKSRHAAKYKQPVPINKQRSYAHTRKLWKAFIRRLKKHQPDVRWLVVLEPHNSEKTSPDKLDTYHLHFATNLFLDWLSIGEIWGHGNVHYQDFKKGDKTRGVVRNPGAYMSKYLGKDFQGEDSYRKRYSCSRNILRPVKVDSATFFGTWQDSRQETVYHTSKTFDLWDTQKAVGGVYGVTQTTYKLREGNTWQN